MCSSYGPENKHPLIGFNKYPPGICMGGAVCLLWGVLCVKYYLDELQNCFGR